MVTAGLGLALMAEGARALLIDLPGKSLIIEPFHQGWLFVIAAIIEAASVPAICFLAPRSRICETRGEKVD